MENTSTTSTSRLIKGKVIIGTLDDPIDDGAVVVRGDRIAWVGEASQLPEEYNDPDQDVIDLPGRTVMPGIIDCHTHISFGEARSEEELVFYTPVEYRTLRAVWNARKVLRAGVTSAFDAASTFNIAVSVRNSIEAGMFEGPRFAVCGRQLTTHQGLEDAFPNWMEFPPGQAGILVKSKDEITEAIRAQVKDGVDCIKVSGSSDSAVFNEPIEGSAFDADEFKLIADETHRLDRVCTVHARSAESVLLTAAAGFDSIMHASYITDEAIELCLKNNIAITPTLTLLTNIVDSSPDDVGASFLDVFKAEVDAAHENLARAYKAGVPLLAGSESGWSLIPYGHWHGREMQTFVENLGMTPLQAIHAATGAAARMLPRWKDDIGCLEAGRLADILVIDGDPIADITVLQKPGRFDYVFKGGAVVDTTTPIPERRVWAFEKHRTYLPGYYHYDEDTGDGSVVD